MNQVSFVTAAFGDLSGDGAQDAAVILKVQMGGSGSLVYLAASVNKKGIPEQAALTVLGDRVQVKSLAVRGGQIVVDMLTFGPKDPMCCPSQLVTRTYGLEGGALRVVGNVTISSSAATSTPAPASIASAKNYKDLSFEIAGKKLALKDGVSEVEAAPGSASKVVTRYFGNEAEGDLNGDGLPDIAFLLTQNPGGSGTFFYVVAALKTSDGYVGTNAVLLGDRIAPQSTQVRDGIVIVNYADRNPGEAMTTAPSVGMSKYFKVVDGKLTVVTH